MSILSFYDAGLAMAVYMQAKLGGNKKTYDKEPK